MLLVVPACGFTARTPGEDMPGDDDPTDEPPPPAARKCTKTDSSLRLCIDFDDEVALTSDGSGRGHDATGSGYMVMNRDSEQAVEVAGTAQLVVAESSDLDLATELTVTLLAQPANRPPSQGSYWALDNNRQYFISYEDDGDFRCGIGSATVDSVIPVPPGNWYHVACTFDRGALKLFIDGRLAGCRTIAETIPTNGTEGLAIGANVGSGTTFSNQFVGGLDNIQVFARTFSISEVCSAAGYSSCPVWPETTGNGPGGFGGSLGACL